MRFKSFEINTKSIRFKIWVYLLIFTLLVMSLIWILQVLFIDSYYDEMQKDDIKDIAVQISSAYKKDGVKGAISEAESIRSDSDLFVVIKENGERKFPSVKDSLYSNELLQIDDIFGRRSYDSKATDGQIKNSKLHRSIYYYVELLDNKSEQTVTPKTETDSQGTDNVKNSGDGEISAQTIGTILYILSPVYPVESTIEFIQRQLAYVTFIALILSFFIGLLLTRRISKPIMDITVNARKLSDGQYGINFPVDTSYYEITNLAETLNKMSNEMERSAMMHRDIIANVSHDLRTPLTMITSYAEMIRDLSGDNPEKRNSHLNVIIEESARLNSLVNDMLALSGMQAGTLAMDIKPFNIYDAVDSILAPYHVLEEKEGYTVNFNCKKDIYVEGDEERIKQVISNLLSNAVKYCGLDKTVLINIRKWGKKVHFEVVDHGVGIKPEELSHIWERYYKTSSNHVRPTRGSGLGLSIVKEILQMHGAKFGVESKVGKGTTVWFELSAVPAPNHE